MKNFENRNDNNYKLRIVILVVAIFLFVLLAILVSLVSTHTEETGELSYDNLTTIKEVIEYYESTYISEQPSEDADFNLDVFLKLAKMPYDENDNSNEKYYNDLLGDCAKVTNYKNLKLIDEENKLTIKIYCKNGKIDKILINDIEDYFIYMDSQISMKNYVEIENVDFEVTSEVLQRVIDNNWDNDNYFGERDSIYNDYYIYFDEGIKARTIQNKIYNIIFTTNYEGNVVNNLFPGVSLDSAKGELGKPSFEDKENGVIGYKGNNVYVFFTTNEISVYRNTNDDADDFFKLADEFINEDIDLLEFMNQLTYMWPDYSQYDYSASSVYLSYPLKGVEIKINYDDTDGILVYNNIKSSMSKIGRYLENTDFVARLQIDCVFEAECNRVIERNSEKTKADEYLETMDENTKQLIGENNKYYYYSLKDTSGSIYEMRFVSIDGNRPDRQLSDSVNEFLWISDTRFVYSKRQKGIFLYDLESGVVTRILEGKKDFILNGYEDGILSYDKNQIEI